MVQGNVYSFLLHCVRLISEKNRYLYKAYIFGGREVKTLDTNISPGDFHYSVSHMRYSMHNHKISFCEEK